MECPNRCFEKGAEDGGCMHMLRHIGILYEPGSLFLNRDMYTALEACFELIARDLVGTPVERVFVRLLRNDFTGVNLLPKYNNLLRCFTDRASLVYFATNVGIPNAMTLCAVPADADGNAVLHLFSVYVVSEGRAGLLHKFYLGPLMRAYLEG